MFRRETQSLLKARAKALEEAEQRVEDLVEENKAVYEENRELRYENEVIKDAFKEIQKLTESNTYNNDRAILSKIKEVLCDLGNQL